MNTGWLIRKIVNKARLPLPLFRYLNRNKESFECPICGYCGPFVDLSSASGYRKHARCPACQALERHRIQYLVLTDIFKGLDTSKMRILHFAPEAFFTPLLSKLFGKYETADLSMPGVDHNVDLQDLPFEDESYDFIFASHVLEHISDDNKALHEISRILSPGSIAVLPVPLVCEKTIEYPAPNPDEAYHVRAPGFDYYDRYEQYFSSVVTITSDSLPDKYQLHEYEDRTQWPTKQCPLRPPMPGEKHIDVVPVCHV